MHLNVRRRLADRIWQSRKITYAVSSFVVALGFIAVFLFISAPTAEIPVSTKPTLFEAGRAFRVAQELADLYPEPAVGSEESSLAAAWVADRLTTLEIPHQEADFTVPLGDREVVMRNVAVVFTGSSREAILISASRDPDLDSRLSPLANATGTAILIDLAQAFAARPHERTIILLSTEGGSYGGLGLNHFLETDPLAADVRAILSLRGLGREKRDVLRAAVSGTDTATPGWYVQLVSQTLGKTGISLEFNGLARQVADEALQLARGEQVAGLRAGVPSIMLYDPQPGEPTSAGIATQGTSVERIILSLDSGSEIPRDPGTAVVLGSGRYVTTRALSLLGVLMLLPAVAMALTWLAVSRVRPEVWLRYLRNLVSFALPLAVWCAMVLAAARVGILPRYLFQAPVTARVATEPDFLVVALLAVLGIAVLFLSRHYLGHLQPREPLIMAGTVKLSTGLLAFVLGLAVLTAHSPLSLLTGVTAAWMWPLVTCFAEPRSASLSWLPRARGNAVLLLAGLAGPIMLYLYLVLSTDIRWWQGWWFLMIQAVSGAYGILGPVASVLITTGFFTLLGVKRLQLIPLETLDDRDDFDLVEAPPRVRRVKKPHHPDKDRLPPPGP